MIVLNESFDFKNLRNGHTYLNIGMKYPPSSSEATQIWTGILGFGG